jgi:hypothetical protein
VLLVLRQHPEEIKEIAPQVIPRLLGIESQLRSTLEILRRHPNGEGPFYSVEWSDLMNSNPALATGPLIDVYLRPDADWSFLKTLPGWDDQKSAWVAVFLFPASGEADGRDQKIAAHEMMPLMEKQLKLAADRESADLFYDVPLGPTDYDMDAQAIKFKFPFAAPLEANSNHKCFRFPVGGGELQRPVGGQRLDGFNEFLSWRSDLGNSVATTSCIQLDHAPRLPSSIPMDIKTAEDSKITHEQLTARVFVTVEGSEPLTRGANDRVGSYILSGRVNQVQVLDGNHTVLATVKGASLPPPEAAVEPTSTPHAPAGKPHPAAIPR